MATDPRPDLFTRICAGLLAAPAVAAVVAGLGLVLTADEALGGPAGLGAALGLVGALPLLVFEYHAVVRRSRRAAAIIAFVALWGAAMGSMAWLAGLLDVLGLKPPGPDAMTAGEFALFTAGLACAIVVGLGHLRWRRVLTAAGGRDGDRGR